MNLFKRYKRLFKKEDKFLKEESYMDLIPGFYSLTTPEGNDFVSIDIDSFGGLEITSCTNKPSYYRINSEVYQSREHYLQEMREQKLKSLGI
jgi:hypothetical protein